MASNDPTPQMINETVLQYLDGDRNMQKKAADAVNDFVRYKVREDSFFYKILPPVQITDDELDRQVDTDKPVKVVDMEIDSPAAYSVPFATLPAERYIKGKRFRVMFDRIMTPKFTKDVNELRTNSYDIRQVISDNSIKDMLAEVDGKFIATVNSIVGTTATAHADLALDYSGAPSVYLNQEIEGGITRDTLVEAKKILPSTRCRLEPATVLVNNVTIREIEKWTRDEMGGDLSEKMVRDGYGEAKFLGLNWIVTVKRELVPDNVIYMFADPKFLGKHYLLEDTTMFIDRKAFMLEFFAYQSAGATLANKAAMCRVKFV